MFCMIHISLGVAFAEDSTGEGCAGDHHTRMFRLFTIIAEGNMILNADVKTQSFMNRS